MKRSHLVLLGAAATLGVAELYHGPLGASDRLEARVERAARAKLDRNEMGQIKAELRNQPLTRTLILSGPADDFQRGELVRVMNEVPGVARVEWDPNSLPVKNFPR
jgi:hypothetical protein